LRFEKLLFRVGAYVAFLEKKKMKRKKWKNEQEEEEVRRRRATLTYACLPFHGTKRMSKS